MAFNATSSSTSEYVKHPMPKILQLVMFLILSVLASAGHMLVILAIYCRRELRTGPYISLLNLSITDVLYAAILLPLEARELYPPSLNSCEARGFLVNLLSLTSVNILCFISIERFVATNYPFKHIQWFTTKVTVTGIAFIWLWCATFAVWPIFSSGYGYKVKFLHCAAKPTNDKIRKLLYIVFQNILPVFVLLYCNFKIVLAVRRRSSGRSPASSERHETRIERERRVTKTVVTVILAIVICFMPYMIMLYCNAIKRSCEFPPEYASAALWLIRCNCCVNPIIYGVMNNRFRKAFKEILCSKCL